MKSFTQAKKAKNDLEKGTVENSAVGSFEPEIVSKTSENPEKYAKQLGKRNWLAETYGVRR